MFFALSDGNDISSRKGVSRKGVEASHLDSRLARNAKKSAATTLSFPGNAAPTAHRLSGSSDGRRDFDRIFSLMVGLDHRGQNPSAAGGAENQ